MGASFRAGTGFWFCVGRSTSEESPMVGWLEAKDISDRFEKLLRESLGILS